MLLTDENLRFIICKDACSSARGEVTAVTPMDVPRSESLGGMARAPRRREFKRSRRIRESTVA